MIKAVFFDIDGTLVSFRTHTVPASTVQALAELKKRGIKTFISTGRHLSEINNLGSLVFDGYITLNGGYCTVAKNRVIYKRTIPAEDIRALIRYQEETTPFPCSVVIEKGMYINYHTPEVEKVLELVDLHPLPERALSDFIDQEVLQLTAFFPKEQEKEMMRILPNCEATRWYPTFADIVPAGSNKSVGMDKISHYFGFEHAECMAFGDGGNDISMLKQAHIGIAMGNADSSVKEAADYTTDSVDRNGIYHALKHFGVI